MKKIAILFTVFILSSGAKASQSICDSSVTKELEACAEKNFNYSDQALNMEYHELESRLSSQDKSILSQAEKDWILYKEATCKGAYDATYPGEEAGIDRLTCLDQITRARIGEIRYISTGIGALGFYKAVELVSLHYENGSRDKFISRLMDYFANSHDSKWRSYVEKNCVLAVSRTHEDKADCIARQVFYRYSSF